MTAQNPVQWARTLGRLALGHLERSPFAEVTQGAEFKIRFDQKVRFELDGGARPASKKLHVKVCRSSVTICVPPGCRQQVLSPDACSLGHGDGNRGEQALWYAARGEVTTSHDDRALGRQKSAGARPAG